MWIKIKDEFSGTKVRKNIVNIEKLYKTIEEIEGRTICEAERVGDSKDRDNIIQIYLNESKSEIIIKHSETLIKVLYILEYSARL